MSQFRRSVATMVWSSARASSKRSVAAADGGVQATQRVARPWRSGGVAKPSVAAGAPQGNGGPGAAGGGLTMVICTGADSRPALPRTSARAEGEVGGRRPLARRDRQPDRRAVRAAGQAHRQRRHGIRREVADGLAHPGPRSGRDGLGEADEEPEPRAGALDAGDDRGGDEDAPAETVASKASSPPAAGRSPGSAAGVISTTRTRGCPAPAPTGSVSVSPGASAAVSSSPSLRRAAPARPSGVSSRAARPLDEEKIATEPASASAVPARKRSASTSAQSMKTSSPGTGAPRSPGTPEGIGAGGGGGSTARTRTVSV